MNYANPVYGVATICHQVRWLRWGHPNLFHTATSPLTWYKMFCVRDISYRVIWMEFINMLSMYAQSGTHSRFRWWTIVVLTHWGRVMHICVRKLTIIGSDNGLSPRRRQAIIRTNAEILLIRPFETKFSEILIEIKKFSFKKMHLKMSSANGGHLVSASMC